MSRYTSVPVSTTIRGCCGWAAAKAAMLAAERRACSAISASAAAPSQRVASCTWATGASQRAQRAAVCQLPLLARAP